MADLKEVKEWIRAKRDESRKELFRIDEYMRSLLLNPEVPTGASFLELAGQRDVELARMRTYSEVAEVLVMVK